MFTQPLVFSIILNTNRRDDTLACLESLQNSTYINHRILVLDNASKDGSVDAIQTEYPNVEIIKLTENLGYAGNNNVGISAAINAGADWVFVLNEDTILAKDCLAQLVSVGKINPKIGILGPMVYHHDEPDVIQSAGGSLSATWESIHVGQNTLDQGQYSNPRTVDWISGCAILVRKEVIQEVGMLDERFFYYWEETEWCIRTSRAGWEIWHIPQAKLWHKGVQRNYQPSPNITYYSTRNRLLMMKKHNAPAQIWMQTWVTNIRTLISWSIRPKWREMRAHRDAMWQGISDFLHNRWGMRTMNSST